MNYIINKDGTVTVLRTTAQTTRAISAEIKRLTDK